MTDPRLYVGGRWHVTGSTFPVINPADGKVLAHVPLGNGSVLEEATREAHAAFCSHRQAAAAERSGHLRALGAAIEARAEAFATVIRQEAGKPITLARAEVQRALHTFTLAAEEARQPHGEVLALDALAAGAGHHGMMRRFPLGVIVALTPFNFPLNVSRMHSALEGVSYTLGLGRVGASVSWMPANVSPHLALNLKWSLALSQEESVR
jgi:glyceraldehyde-3-phosphate dehydrogenase (NADP+)